MRGTVFRSDRDGEAAVFGPLEGVIMARLWDARRPQSVRDVLTAVNADGRDLNYSTVKAVLNNLHDKGHLEKAVQGRATIFWPRMEREAFQAHVVSDVVGSLKRNFGAPVIAHLIAEVAEDPAALETFEKLLAERKAAKGR